jgi:hypothetical protein
MGIAATSLLLLAWAGAGLAQQPGTSFGQMTRPFVRITDPDLIEFFTYEFMIPETTIAYLDVVDVTNNGFGEDDLIIAYPSYRVHTPAPSDSAQRIMGTWKFKAETQIDAENVSAATFDSLNAETPENAILSGLLHALERNYFDFPIKILFERDRESFRFQMWDYNQTALYYTPPPPPAPDTVVTYDVVHAIREDTVFVADTTYYDMLYVFRTVSDTVFVPANMSAVEMKSDGAAAVSEEKSSPTPPRKP